MVASGLCEAEETGINNDFGKLAVDKHKQIQKPKPVRNHNMDDMKTQRAPAAAVSEGCEIQNCLEEIKNNREQPVQCAEDEEKIAVQTDNDNLVLRQISNNFLTEGIPEFWMNRINMQNAYSLEAKGWKVKVKWEKSLISGAGVGAFVEEYVKKGQLIRAAKTGKNLVRLRSKSDLPKMSSVTKNYISNYCAQVDDFTMMFLPGNCFNHSIDPNVDMIPIDEETIHIVAVHDIKAGTELTQDYYSFGEPPEYLTELAKNGALELVFYGYNGFL